jgi:RHS repeat-associated protein
MTRDDETRFEPPGPLARSWRRAGTPAANLLQPSHQIRTLVHPLLDRAMRVLDGRRQHQLRCDEPGGGGDLGCELCLRRPGTAQIEDGGITTTIFATDADNREILEYDGSSGAVQRWYAFGQGPDAVLSQMNTAAGTRATMIPDNQGSIVATLDSATGALTKSGYQPYGENPTLTTGTYRYTARRFDPETAGSASQPSGLYYYRSRMYSPTWGRFPQPDLIGYAGGPNLYAYTDNDPLNRTDPFGTCDNPQGCGAAPTGYLPNGSTLSPPSTLPPSTAPFPVTLSSTMAVDQFGPSSGSTTESQGSQIAHHHRCNWLLTLRASGSMA